MASKILWQDFLPEFNEKTAAFYAGTLSKNDYKGFSGFYGSYAQRGGSSSMLRLRMSAGRVTREKLKFVADSIRKYNIDCVHFTTCETIQLHNLSEQTVTSLIAEAVDAGIITMGGGGDFPRNVMCSPLSGVQEDEYFDVLPWAEAAADYLMGFITAEKMPRKLKVCFSNSKANLPHATYRDLGFAANENKTFDVYSAGGLGNNARMGVKVAENVKPSQILYYIKAMWLTFRAYGNYENRGRARTRYMPEKLGGNEAYKAAFLEKLDEVYSFGEDLTLNVSADAAAKTGDGSLLQGKRVLEQKQNGLYTVMWHPLGGKPDPAQLCALSDVLEDIEGAEMRLSPDESAYIINLTGAEAARVIEATSKSAETLFETSVSCIGAGICQVGLRDSQKLLLSCVDAVRKAQIPDGALPQIHISGCPSSCGTHQTGAIGFRGASKQINKKPQSAFVLFVNGNERQGEEAFGRELGTMPESDIPAFLVSLGKAVAESGMSYSEWSAANPDGIDAIAAPLL